MRRRPPNEGFHTVGQVAKQAGVGISTVRYYEREGLVAPVKRTAANYRLYAPETVARIRFMRRAQHLGFTLAEIKELLSLRVEGGKRCTDFRGAAAAKMADIESRIRSLRRMSRALARLARDCEAQGNAAGCPMLEHLEGES